jgi:hypothetical protein
MKSLYSILKDFNVFDSEEEYGFRALGNRVFRK